MNIGIFPDAALESWSDIEIAPVCDYGDYVERCAPEEADFWSVYLRLNTGGATCIADVPTKRLALRMAELIENIANSSRTDITISIGKNISIKD